ncbi:hypothetical protein GCM10017771_86980 [Streptomyces capitiformicae]|uniref:Uncharacterized protein n=1 Tax=Streptomyces capitiformicae TaxID=2014920 RepID=A0A918ZPK0_9ACTN|nr:hypothetical protein GCM10017771_86980 [Streptomyces capitiformicae]
MRAVVAQDRQTRLLALIAAWMSPESSAEAARLFGVFDATEICPIGEEPGVAGSTPSSRSAPIPGPSSTGRPRWQTPSDALARHLDLWNQKEGAFR